VRAHINIDESGKRERQLGAVKVSTDQTSRTQNPALFSGTRDRINSPFLLGGEAFFFERNR